MNQPELFPEEPPSLFEQARHAINDHPEVAAFYRAVRAVSAHHRANVPDERRYWQARTVENTARRKARRHVTPEVLDVVQQHGETGLLQR